MIDRVSNVVFSIKMWQNIINGCVCFKKMTPDHKAILSTFIHKKREQIEYLHNGVELIFKSQKSWITAPNSLRKYMCISKSFNFQSNKAD